MEQTTNKEILEKLRKLEIDINFIKDNMIDKDCILTSEEEENIDIALKEYENGETISHEELKKELGI